MSQAIHQLRRQLETLAPSQTYGLKHGQVGFGVSEIDAHLGGGLGLAMLHETYAAETADMASSSGFAASFMQRIAGRDRRKKRPVVWIRQTMSESETGRLYPHGLAGLGFDPANLIFVRVRQPIHFLSAGLEAVRCTSLAGVIIEAWGAPKELDLTATRRLALAAEKSGVTPFLLRAATDEQPSAAFTRWQVASAPSRALEANAPGHPTFDITLLRNKAGTHGQSWRVEWHHDLGQFQLSKPEWNRVQSVRPRLGKPAPGKPLSGRVVSVPARQPVAASGSPTASPFKRTG